MTAKDFTAKYFPFAKASQQQTGIPAIATMAQAALESGWGEHCPGNMMFGIKAAPATPAQDQQLIITFEYNRSATLTAAQIGLQCISNIEPVTMNGQKYFKYTGQSYFRKYDTPEDSFTDHSRFFLENNRYAKALEVKNDADAFIDAISAAGYAQSPTYAATLKSIAHTIQIEVQNLAA